MNKTKKLLFVTGSMENGDTSQSCKIRDDDELSYEICATNMHLRNTHGYSVKEIENDGYRVDHKF